MLKKPVRHSLHEPQTILQQIELDAIDLISRWFPVPSHNAVAIPSQELLLCNWLVFSQVIPLFRLSLYPLQVHKGRVTWGLLYV